MSLTGPSLPSPSATVIVYAIAEDVHCDKKTEAIYNAFKKTLSSNNTIDVKNLATDQETPKKTKTTYSVFIASKDSHLLHDTQKNKKFVYQELTKKQFQQKFPKSQGALAIDMSNFEKTTTATQDVGTSIVTKSTLKKARSISVLPASPIDRQEARSSSVSTFNENDQEIAAQQSVAVPSLTPPPMTRPATPSATGIHAVIPPPAQELASARASADQNQSVSSMILTNIRNINRSVKELENHKKKSGAQQLLSFGRLPQLIQAILAPIKNIKTLIGNSALGEDWSQTASINKKMLSALIKAYDALSLMSQTVFSTDSRKQLDDDFIHLLGVLSNFTPPQTHETSTDQKQLEGILAANRKLIDIYQQQLIKTVSLQKIPDLAERRSKRIFFAALLLPLYEKNCQLAELLLDLKGEDANLQEILYTSDKNYTAMSRYIKDNGPERRQAWL